MYIMLETVKNKESYNMETRLGKISSKRQLTIPKDFYDRLKLGENVELVLEKDYIKIMKLKRIEENFDDYSDLILKDLIKEGYTDEELLKEFRLRKKLFPIAVQNMLQDVREQVKTDTRTSEQLNKELFEED